MISDLYTYVIECLPTSGRALQTVADETGIPVSTLEKIASGEIHEPGVHKIQKLANYFAARAKVERQQADKAKG